MANHFCVIDTETTNLKPSEGVLLTAAFRMIDPKTLKISASLDLYVKHDIYVVSPGALKVNHIDIVTHHDHPDSVTPKDAARKLFEFWRPYIMGNPKDKIVLIGHVTHFDLGWLQTHLAPESDMWKRVSHRVIDTAAIAMFMQFCGLIPRDLDTGLWKLAEHYEIDYPAHTAAGDAEATLKLLRKMVRQVKAPSS